MNTIAISTRINGREVETVVPTRQTMAEFLRDQLGLTGTKLSCEMQVCGVCTVLVNGDPISSCNYLAADMDQKVVTTIEGLADEDLHPIQQAFVDSFALQCGFCTPGFVMMAVALLGRSAHPSREEVAGYLEGNICRCTGYRPIIDAVIAASESQGSRPHD